MPDFVAYYRVSTDKQGERGLGIEAQREAIRHVVKDGAVIAEFVEVESGKSHKNRPQLTAAMQTAKKHKATLVVAKLDRLARNVHFISGLIESKVEFRAADMLDATTFTLHMMAAFAQYEREQISGRTKAALQQVKKELAEKGTRISKAGKVFTKLGNPRLSEAQQKGADSNRTNVPTPIVVELVESMRSKYSAWKSIADALNKLGNKTGRGTAWYGSTVRSMMIRYAKTKEETKA